jgi:ubiquinone/menaquinone biosynthesis C-methylase UbiE
LDKENLMPTWDELFMQEEFRWKNPHEQVVALVSLLRQRGARRVLDLGCGAGRHTVYLAREGFEVWAMDIAENGLAHTREWLGRENLSAELKQSDISQIPFPADFFDAVISIYVIYHQTYAGMLHVVGEIHRVLKRGGLALISMQSTRGWRYGQGKEIEPNTFILNVGADAGVPHHYSDLAEIADMFQHFAIRKVEQEERYEEGNRHSHWQALVEKE